MVTVYYSARIADENQQQAKGRRAGCVGQGAGETKSRELPVILPVSCVAVHTVLSTREAQKALLPRDVIEGSVT